MNKRSMKNFKDMLVRLILCNELILPRLSSINSRVCVYEVEERGFIVLICLLIRRCKIQVLT